MNLIKYIQKTFPSVEILKTAIKESHSLLTEGAWTNEGLYWISPKGKVILVNSVKNKSWSMGHEEFANAKWNCSLEDALHKGYVRLQSVSPQYLFVDHQQHLMRNAQIPAITGFFFDEEMEKIPYDKMLVERVGDMHTFKKGQNSAALQFTVSGEHIEDTEESPISNSSAGPMQQLTKLDLDTTHPSYKRPGVNPFGDSVDYSFLNWIAKKKKTFNSHEILIEPRET